MKRMIAQKFIDWCKSVFDFLQVSSDKTKVEIGSGLEVDGNAAINGYLNSAAEYSADGVINNATMTLTASSNTYLKAVLKNGILTIAVSFYGYAASSGTAIKIADFAITKEIGTKIVPSLGAAGIIRGDVVMFGTASNIELRKDSDLSISMWIMPNDTSAHNLNYSTSLII